MRKGVKPGGQQIAERRWPPLLVVLLSFGLRLYHLRTQSLWYDEAFSVWLSRQSPAQIVANVELGHTPFYFLLLHGWMLLAGQSEQAIRYLSLLAGVLTVPAAYMIGKRLFGRAVALATATLVATSPLAIWYSQETRMYSVVMLVASLSTYFMIRGLEGESRFWFAYAAAAAILPYVHLYGLMVVLAQALFAAGCLGLGTLRGEPRRRLIHWLMAQTAAGLLFLPWGLWRANAFEGYVSAAASSLSLGSMFWQTVIAFTSYESIARPGADLTIPSNYDDYRLALLLGGGSLAVIALGLLSSRGQRAGSASLGPHVRPVLLLAVLLALPFASVYLTSLGRRAYASKYLIGIAPFFYLLLAYAWDSLRQRLPWSAAPAAALVIGTFALSLSNYYNQPRFWREDYRAVAAYAAAHAHPQEVFVCDAGYSGIALDYYRPGQEPCQAVPATYPPDRAAIEGQLQALAQRYRFLWLVLWQDYYADPDKVVLNWLNAHAYRVEDRSYPGGLRLKGYYLSAPVVGEAEVPNRLGTTLGGKVKLVGYEYTPPQAGTEGRVKLFWQALTPLLDYRVFLHVIDQAGNMWAQHDGPPAAGAYPTTLWPPGRIIVDEHPLNLPALIPPVSYRLEVGMYESGSMRRLGKEGDDLAVIPGFAVARGHSQAPPVETPLSAVFESRVALLGYDYGGAKEGDSLHFTLYWKSLGRIDTDYTVFVHLLDKEGNLRAQGDYPPVHGIFPTSQWQPGDVVRDERVVALPPDLPPGDYSLIIGLYDPGNGQRLRVETCCSEATGQDKLELLVVPLK